MSLRIVLILSAISFAMGKSIISPYLNCSESDLSIIEEWIGNNFRNNTESLSPEWKNLLSIYKQTGDKNFKSTVLSILRQISGSLWDYIQQQNLTKSVDHSLEVFSPSANGNFDIETTSFSIESLNKLNKQGNIMDPVQMNTHNEYQSTDVPMQMDVTPSPSFIPSLPELVEPSVSSYPESSSLSNLLLNMETVPDFDELMNTSEPPYLTDMGSQAEASNVAIETNLSKEELANLSIPVATIEVIDDMDMEMLDVVSSEPILDIDTNIIDLVSSPPYASMYSHDVSQPTTSSFDKGVITPDSKIEVIAAVPMNSASPPNFDDAIFMTTDLELTTPFSDLTRSQSTNQEPSLSETTMTADDPISEPEMEIDVIGDLDSPMPYLHTTVISDSESEFIEVVNTPATSPEPQVLDLSLKNNSRTSVPLVSATAKDNLPNSDAAKYFEQPRTTGQYFEQMATQMPLYNTPVTPVPSQDSSSDTEGMTPVDTVRKSSRMLEDMKGVVDRIIEETLRPTTEKAISSSESTSQTTRVYNSEAARETTPFKKPIGQPLKKSVGHKNQRPLSQSTPTTNYSPVISLQQKSHSGNPVPTIQTTSRTERTHKSLTIQQIPPQFDRSYSQGSGVTIQVHPSYQSGSTQSGHRNYQVRNIMQTTPQIDTSQQQASSKYETHRMATTDTIPQGTSEYRKSTRPRSEYKYASSRKQPLGSSLAENTQASVSREASHLITSTPKETTLYASNIARSPMETTSYASSITRIPMGSTSYASNTTRAPMETTSYASKTFPVQENNKHISPTSDSPRTVKLTPSTTESSRTVIYTSSTTESPRAVKYTSRTTESPRTVIYTGGTTEYPRVVKYPSGSVTGDDARRQTSHATPQPSVSITTGRIPVTTAVPYNTRRETKHLRSTVSSSSMPQVKAAEDYRYSIPTTPNNPISGGRVRTNPDIATVQTTPSGSAISYNPVTSYADMGRSMSTISTDAMIGNRGPRVGMERNLTPTTVSANGDNKITMDYTPRTTTAKRGRKNSTKATATTQRAATGGRPKPTETFSQTYEATPSVSTVETPTPPSYKTFEEVLDSLPKFNPATSSQATPMHPPRTASQPTTQIPPYTPISPFHAPSMQQPMTAPLPNTTYHIPPPPFIPPPFHDLSMTSPSVTPTWYPIPPYLPISPFHVPFISPHPTVAFPPSVWYPVTPFSPQTPPRASSVPPFTTEPGTSRRGRKPSTTTNEDNMNSRQPTLPQQTIGQQTVPQQMVTKETAPQELLPQQTVQQRMVTQQTATQQTVPQQTAPQQTVPQQMLPQHTVPQRMVPQQIVTQQTMRQHTMQQQRVSQQSMPQHTMQQQIMTQQTMSEQTTPQQMVQQQTMPQQIVGDNTANHNFEWTDYTTVPTFPSQPTTEYQRGSSVRTHASESNEAIHSRGTTIASELSTPSSSSQLGNHGTPDTNHLRMTQSISSLPRVPQTTEVQDSTLPIAGDHQSVPTSQGPIRSSSEFELASMTTEQRYQFQAPQMAPPVRNEGHFQSPTMVRGGRARLEFHQRFKAPAIRYPGPNPSQPYLPPPRYSRRF